MPTLEAVQHAGLTDVAVVVTRYFGGILLGTGGLVRAYTQATQAGIEAARTVVISRCVDVVFEVPYALYEQTVRIAEECGARTLDVDFGGEVLMTLRMLDGTQEALFDRDDRVDARAMRADGGRAHRGGVLTIRLRRPPSSAVSVTQAARSFARTPSSQASALRLSDGACSRAFRLSPLHRVFGAYILECIYLKSRIIKFAACYVEAAEQVALRGNADRVREGLGGGCFVGQESSSPVVESARAPSAGRLKRLFQINAPLLICVFRPRRRAFRVACGIVGVQPRGHRPALRVHRDGRGIFRRDFPPLLFYGALLALITVSTRINTDFIASLTDNVYSFGMQERLIAAVHDADMIDLLRKNVNEDFNYIVRQSRALNRIVGGLCSIGGKAFSLGSLAMVAYALSSRFSSLPSPTGGCAGAEPDVYEGDACELHQVPQGREVKAQFLQNMPLEANIAKEVRVYGCADEVVSSWRAAYPRASTCFWGRTGRPSAPR